MVQPLLILLIASLLAAAAGARLIVSKNLHLWLPAFFRQEARRRLEGPRAPDQPIHVLLCIADHFEPACGAADGALADARVAAWIEQYPLQLGGFRDSDGRPPRHTFFYPIDQYQPEHVDALAGLCRAGFGEVEIHLHHDHDTPEILARTLRRFTDLFARAHGLLGRWPDGRPAFGFVHGNWALDNARHDGRWCGVCDELSVLAQAGCYADFTLPSAPDPTQTRTINSIYYAQGRPGRCKGHDRGRRVGLGPPPADALMLIQGPLRLWWPRGSRMPRIENGCLQRSQPPSPERLDQWIRAGVSVQSRPDWVFIKLHSHGAVESNRTVLLGEPMKNLHRELARRAARDPRFHYHYVTAREMHNLVKAAEAGWRGPVTGAIDFTVFPPRKGAFETEASRSAYAARSA